MLRPRVTVRAIEADVEVDPEDVLNELSTEEVVEHYGDALLEEFDREHVMEFFGITEDEGEIRTN